MIVQRPERSACMGEQKRLLKNSAIIAIGGFSSKVIAFLLLPIYTSYLSTSEYGSYDYIVSFATMLAPFVTMLMQESMFRFLIDAEEEDRSKVISNSIIIICTNLAALTVIMLGVFAFTKNTLVLYILFYIYALIPGTCVSAILRGIGEMGQYALYNFIISFATVIFNIFFIVVLKMGLLGLFSGFVVAHLLVSVVFLIRIKIWKLVHYNELSKPMIKRMLTYSIPLIPNSISWTIINFSDRLIVFNVLDPSANGIYSVSNKFPSLIDTVYGFFLTAWKESAARVLHGTQEEIAKFYNSMYKNLKHLLFSFSLFVTAAMPFLFRIFVNEKFYDGYIYTVILIFGVYFSNISGFYGGIFSAYMKTKIMGTTTIVAAIINIVVNLLMIKNFGLYAAAVSTFVANFVICVYRRIKLNEYMAFDGDMKFCIGSTIFSVAVVFLFLQNTLLTSIVNMVLVMGFTYFTNQELLRKAIPAIKSRISRKRG